jgi:hypothetical protein
MNVRLLLGLSVIVTSVGLAVALVCLRQLRWLRRNLAELTRDLRTGVETEAKPRNEDVRLQRIRDIVRNVPSAIVKRESK